MKLIKTSCQKYLIRQMLVFAMYKFIVPQTLNDLLSKYEDFDLNIFDIALLKNEWDALFDAEIFCKTLGFDTEYAVLSPNIRYLLDKGFSLIDHTFLYGMNAIGYKDQLDYFRQIIQSELKKNSLSSKEMLKDAVQNCIELSNDQKEDIIKILNKEP